MSSDTKERRILLSIAPGPGQERVVAEAAALARSNEAELCLFWLGSRSWFKKKHCKRVELESIAERLRREGVKVRCFIRSRTSLAALAGFAKKLRAGLILIGGAAGPAGWSRSSRTAKLSQVSSVPVLVIPPAPV